MLVTLEGMKMDPSKFSAIKQWPVPDCLHNVYAFIEFSNFYRRFIEGFSQMAHPLMTLTKTDIPFECSIACQSSFERLKKFLISAPILYHFDHERKIVVETNASNLVITGFLSQYDDNILHPIAYFLGKHSPAEINYEIYEKELLTIVLAFKEWHPPLEGSSHTIKGISDH
jgi:hypothetical protein